MTEQFDTPLDDVKTDAVRATELLDVAGIDYNMLADPVHGGRVQEILRFFSDKEDAEYVLNKLKIQSRGEDTFGHVYRFTKLNMQREDAVKTLLGLDKELSLYD